MRVTVIGGTGHIGSFLVPRLVDAGHHVTVVTRKKSKPYLENEAWKQVHWVEIDRVRSEEEGRFGKAVAEHSPDVVIDLICFKLQSLPQLVDALQDRIGLFMHCGSVWVHGEKTETPSEEHHPRRPLGEYGIQKAAIEAYLLHEVDQQRFPSTVLHPGHIVGPGWTPINPVGNFNRDVFHRLATGQELMIPNLGLETLHHVHADDVATGFMQALMHRDAAKGESFHILSEKALTWRGYAEALADWYGQKPNLRFVAWDEFRAPLSDEDAACSWDHLVHCTSGTIEKARRKLNYVPRYSSLDAVKDALGRPTKP